MTMKRVAVLTSGGDAPGMNAAIRAVVRAGVEHGWQMHGVRQGYAGLMAGDYRTLEIRDVGGILPQAGTMLGSARAPEFRSDAGKKQALHHLNQAGIEALVVIGGNGSQAGAHALHTLGFPVVGIASTIDNDLYGSDVTLGVDTALNIALEAVDRLRVTASSHTRAFLLEVMGRDCGYLALMVGIAGGAELVVIPEYEVSAEHVLEVLQTAYAQGKTHGIIVVAEGAKNDTEALMKHIKGQDVGFEVRATILGHVQRGGAPTAYDRILGARLGAGAIAALARGARGVLVGIQKGELTRTPHDEVVDRKKPLDESLMHLVTVLGK
jgi:6-phosphofructokinase 1